jgi:hypothetical protein
LTQPNEIQTRIAANVPNVKGLLKESGRQCKDLSMLKSSPTGSARICPCQKAAQPVGHGFIRAKKQPKMPGALAPEERCFRNAG